MTWVSLNVLIFIKKIGAKIRSLVSRYFYGFYSNIYAEEYYIYNNYYLKSHRGDKN